MLAAAPAAAQAGLSLSATSDFIYRGYSLSAERPAAIGTVAYDHESGVYASASAIAVAAHGGGVRVSGYQAYAGFARRFDADSSWEVGVARTDVSQPYRTRYRVTYDEIYVGASSRRFSAHVYYSPDYLGEKTQTVYATVSGTLTPAPGWKVFGKAGLLLPVQRRADSEIRRAQYDVGVGVARRIGDIELQAAASLFGPDDDLVAGVGQGRAAVTASATFYF